MLILFPLQEMSQGDLRPDSLIFDRLKLEYKPVQDLIAKIENLTTTEVGPMWQAHLTLKYKVPSFYRVERACDSARPHKQLRGLDLGLRRQQL